MADVVGNGSYLTRLHTFVHPDQMTSDPRFVRDPEAPDVSREHVLGWTGSDTGSWSAGPLGLLMLGLPLRRRR